MVELASSADGEAAERSLMDELFSAHGRTHPEDVARASTAPGCRYAFVNSVLHDPRFVAPSMPTSPDLMFQVVGRFMSRLPPERHLAVRAQFSGLFTARRVVRYRDRIVDRARLLLDRFPVDGPVDFVSAFARPLPFAVLAEVLGIPVDQHAWLASSLEAFGRAVAGQRDHANVELGNTAVVNLLSFFDEALTKRAADGGDDLLALIARTPADTEQRADLLANCLFFIIAGHVTTTALLAAGVDVLLSHPKQLELVISEPDRWPAAVEELLRYVSPTTLTAAKATADTTVDGYAVAAGSQRALVFAGANRDPAVFADPDRFDISRNPNQHLAFAAGAHFCLGAPLARMHAHVALPAVFNRLPGLRVVGGPEWIGSVPVRQISSLQIDWDR